jgi:hypothetical protein
VLVIRKEQMEVFYDATGGVFEDQLVEHFKLSAPHQFLELGEEGLRSVIKYGMDRADNYGFTMRGPSRFYVESMLILGSDFDTDPQYPWAFQVLSDQQTRDEVRRADALHSRLTDYLATAAAPKMVYRSILAARTFLGEEPPNWDRQFEAAMLETARTVWPEKHDYVGESQLHVLVKDSEHRGEHFDIATGAGISLLFILAYVLGHGCAFDPQFPWIAESLTHIDPAERHGLLLEASNAYLTRALANLEEEV